jgi:hypothetical protein
MQLVIRMLGRMVHSPMYEFAHLLFVIQSYPHGFGAAFTASRQLNNLHDIKNSINEEKDIVPGNHILIMHVGLHPKISFFSVSL